MYFAGVSLCWMAADIGVPEAEVRAASGLSLERFDRAGEELYDLGVAWPYTGGTWQFDTAMTLVQHAIGAPGRPSSAVWMKLKAKAIAYHGAACVYCGSIEDLALDHVVPLRLGGSNHPGNLVPACMPCNSAKGGRSWAEWASIIGRKK